MRHRKNKKEFSKSLLIQESALIWITSLAYIVLAFYCISNGYTGSLPWITASASLPWAAYGEGAGRRGERRQAAGVAGQIGAARPPDS